MLIKINVLNSVAKVFNLAPDLDITESGEMQMAFTQKKTAQINESLLSHLDSTNMVYYGGSVKTSEILNLKRILFRSTRGHAVIT